MTDESNDRATKRQAEQDQGMAAMADMMPALLSMHHEKLKERFTDQQAWELVKVIAFAMAGGKGMV